MRGPTPPEGALPFRPATMLAPMEGFTHPTFRRLLAERGGVGAVCTEFVRVPDGGSGARSFRRAVVAAPGAALSVQVMGRDLDAMAEAAAIVEEAGADIVDVNLGCPTPRAVRGGVGAAMLRDPDLLERVLAAMRRRIRIPLSAKMRAGFDRDDLAPEIARRIEGAGADFLVVHARRRSDGFAGVADWRIIGAIKQSVGIPVVGNGDCWYAADASRMTAESHCDGVMIGRPALRNPWIFEQIEDLRAGRPPRRPSGKDLYLHLVEVVERLRPDFGGREQGLLAKMKELVRFLTRSLPDGKLILETALRVPSLGDLLRHAERAFVPLACEQVDLGAHGELALERSGSSRPWPRDDAAW